MGQVIVGSGDVIVVGVANNSGHGDVIVVD